MKKWLMRYGVAAVAAMIASNSSSNMGMAAEAPATQPSPATQPNADAAKQAFIEKERTFVAALQEAGKAMGNPNQLGDAAHRQQVSAAAVPALKKELAALDDLSTEHKIPPGQIAMLRSSAMASLYALGDKETVSDVDARAGDSDPGKKSSGQTIQLQANWWLSGSDSTARAKIVDQIIQLDQSDPTNVSLTQLTYQLSRSTTNQALTDKLQDAAVAMNNPMAAQLKEMAEGQKKLASLEGKPLVVSGKSVDGSNFSTEQWKGKVVLVDFWATWCGPCRAELPNVKAAYTKYHDQGFEIVGVSNDFSKDALTAFTPKNGMPWPELFDADAAGNHNWNPITLGYGIYGIPTMFLIDRNGVCNSVNARGKLEVLIPKLLAEPAAAAPKTE